MTRKCAPNCAPTQPNERYMNEKSGNQQPKEIGPPLANTTAVKHGLYRAKSKDPIKSQRIRRRVNRRLEGVPREFTPLVGTGDELH